MSAREARRPRRPRSNPPAGLTAGRSPGRADDEGGTLRPGIDRGPGGQGHHRVAAGGPAGQGGGRRRRAGGRVRRRRLLRGPPGPARAGHAARRRRGGQDRGNLVPATGPAGPLVRLPDAHPRRAVAAGRGRVFHRLAAHRLRPAGAPAGPGARRDRGVRAGEVRRAGTAGQAVSGPGRRGAVPESPLRLPPGAPRARRPRAPHPALR